MYIDLDLYIGLPNENFLDLSTVNAFAADKINVDLNIK